jgi:L-fuconolactonase
VIIDAHQHVWDLERAEYPWLGPELGSINRTIEFEELAPTLARCGITGSVLVQAADNAEDTALMLDVARRHPQVLAVVAWAPLDSPADLPDHLERLAEHSVVRGVRNLFHARPREWATSPQVDRGLGVLVASGLSLDFVTSDPAALADLPGIGERHPTLRIVIDHLGKPPIGGTPDQRAEWRLLLAAAADNPLTHAKLSGLYSSVGDLASWAPDDLLPFVDDAFELFGPERLMYGGDWPISELAGGYERVWAAMDDVVAELSPDERADVLGLTARSFYLEERA